MRLNLITLGGVKYSEEAYMVSLPTLDGDIAVYPDHEPLLSVIRPGVITVRRQAKDQDNRLEHYATFGGVLEVVADEVRVLVDEADHGDEINEAEARKAREAAEAMLKSAKSQVEIEQAQALVDRQAVRLQVANLRRRHQR